ncbi:unnamed protein product [Rotaria sordida]|uniref:Biopterin-dependent aromatic amino acid hydroxylase family profile domain-containing protein n=1 Tax=Rotaria sordida TaxID=392033 RepID=A0A813Z1C4_9BILA|nr:unnamed protein product [Rotaria sordida]
MAFLLNDGTSKPSFRKSYSIEYGYKPRKRTLIADAEFDREQHDEEQHKHQHQHIKHDEQVKEECTYTILVTIKDKKSASILNLINTFSRDGLKVQHMETRPTVVSPDKNQSSTGLDIFMEVLCTDKLMDDLKRDLFQSDSKFIIKNIKTHAATLGKESKETNNENDTNDIIWFPMSIWELDKCHHLHTNYQPDMDSRHPGFSDKAYRARRERIAEIAFDFRHDVVHELLGHVPLLSNPSFAQFSQDIGLASLGVSDDDIVKLSTLYWFTVEFGLCRENGQIKAYGAGLLSSFGELQHALSSKPEIKLFEPETTVIQEYQDEDYQPIYFLAETFEDAKEKLRIYAKSLKRPYELVYNPYTQSLRILDNIKVIHDFSAELKLEMDVLEHALDRLHTNGINFKVVS